MSPPATSTAPNMPHPRVLAWTASLAEYTPDKEGIVTVTRMLGGEFPVKAFVDPLSRRWCKTWTADPPTSVSSVSCTPGVRQTRLISSC